MRNDDIFARLCATDPVAQSDLSRIDPGALSALREGITMSTPEKAPTAAKRARRLGRRGLFAAGISVALVGGGAAYAAHLEFLGGDGDGLNCQHVWNDTATGVTGANLTGDPIADCGVFVAKAGLAPITDPVAFTYHGFVFVTPRDQVPESAHLLKPSPDHAATRELQASMGDMVDGSQAHCLDPAAATAFAHSEVNRLGLTGWSIQAESAHPTEVAPPSLPDPTGTPNAGPQPMPGATIVPLPVALPETPCTLSMVDIPKKAVIILPNRAQDHEGATGAESSVRDALRTGITDACVSATDARAVADAALAGLPYAPWPTTTVVDETVPCARVDMEVGGSIQVTVYGPTVGHP
ncbi:hypothetical protein [Cellulomonas sp. URHD0024]|uniref:hypothetical protein n=1 Tax=Cellulomonas sp. URHD0024 TaxID=1302620 RepID=UPI0003FFD52C|nr:hypothetical protein [Cellulomonas sp. URHD0024]